MIADYVLFGIIKKLWQVLEKEALKIRHERLYNEIMFALCMTREKS